MPVQLFENHHTFGNHVFWKIEEDESYFKDRLKNSGLALTQITDWRPKRRKEWLAGRYLIQKFMQIDLNHLMVDDNGKLQVAGYSGDLSISHCDDQVALQWSPRPIGLDIQVQIPQIARIASKFCTDLNYSIFKKDHDPRTIEWITWGLKEATFKAYGKGQLSYADHILFRKYEKSSSGQIVEIEIVKDTDVISYAGRIQIWGNLCVCQVVQRQLH